MGNIFKNIDIVQVLGVGLSGFAFLLILMSFWLLKSEQSRPQIRKPVLTSIYIFMALSLLFVVVVGIISSPLISQNIALKDSLNVSQSGRYIAVETKNATESAVLHKDSVKAQIVASVQVADSASKILGSASPELKENIMVAQEKYGALYRIVKNLPASIGQDSLSKISITLKSINTQLSNSFLKPEKDTP